MSQVYRKYTELTAKHYSMQESKNSKIEEKEDEPEALDQSINVGIRNHLSSNTHLSLPSKALELRSHHSTQNIPWGIEFQRSWIFDFPLPSRQQAKSSNTPFGITHWIPTRLNIQFQRSVAMGQCKRRWSVDSPLALHTKCRISCQM